MPKGLERASARLALGVAGLLLPLIALEIAARLVLDPRPGNILRRLIPNESNCLVRSELLGLELAPRCKGTTISEGIETNELGLRDSPVREDGARRILAIGDSCTYGWAVAQRDAYPQVLQTLLDERYRGRFRVINAGVPGFMSHHGLLYLQERGLALRPEIVIFGFGFNDFWRGGNVEAALAWNRRFLSLVRLDDSLINHSSFWRWASVQRRRAFGEEEPQGMSLEDYLRNLTEIVELARAHGARVLMLVFEVHGPPVWDLRSRAVLEQAATLGVPALRYSGPTLDPVHPTKQGYAALALEILERLEAEGYLSDAAAGGPVRRGGSHKASTAAP